MLGPFLHAIERPVDYHFAASRLQWTVRLSGLCGHSSFYRSMLLGLKR